MTKQKDVVESAIVDESGNDQTELALRMWGVSGEPVTWASLSHQPIIAAARMANTGFGDVSAVQSALDMMYPDYGYDATKVALPHPPTAVFTAIDGDPDKESAGVVRVELTDDAELGLPTEQVRWDFGDDTDEVFGAGGWEHGYAAEGTYTIQVVEMVGGIAYSTTQEYTVTEAPLEPVAKAKKKA